MDEKFFFSIDKADSLKIIHELQSKMEKDKVCLFHKYDYTDKSEAIETRHLLSVIQINIDLTDSDHINEHYQDLKEAIKDEENINVCDSGFRIYKINVGNEEENENKSIEFEADMWGSQADGDVAFPKFIYNENYNCWMIMDDFWNCENGIDPSGLVWILNFGG